MPHSSKEACPFSKLTSFYSTAIGSTYLILPIFLAGDNSNYFGLAHTFEGLRCDPNAADCMDQTVLDSVTK